MALFPLLLLAVIIAYSCGYALVSDPSLSWPTEYHFNAEEINLSNGILKPFEIWYSTKNNRSRISLFDGTVSRYYVGIYIDEEGYEHDSKVYMVHPEVGNDDTSTELKCELMPSWGDQEDFLPSLDNFVYAGIQEHDGKQLQLWTHNIVRYHAFKIEESILVKELSKGIGIPVHHYKKKFSLKDGSLESDKVINYYNYNSKIKEKDLDPHREDCESWDEFPRDLHSAVKRLHPSIASDVDIAFHKYKNHHDREYKHEEHDYRKAIFHDNWEFIEQQNQKKLGFILGLNEYADRTMEELSYLSGMKAPYGPIKMGTHKFPHTMAEIEDMADQLPENFDLRMEGVLTPVRNQAECGSCWAFAAAATLEGVLARASRGNIVDLSEQSLVDCAWQYRSHGCEGTEAIDAVYEYLMKHGIPTVHEYGPYLGEDGRCNINNMTNVYRIKGFVGVTKNSPNALRAAVYKYGPVTIGVLVTRNMVYYKSGVFYDMECEQGPMNHAVTLIGYGVKDGDLYWIVKNSWGESWGEAGYILISATEDNCNVMNAPYYPIV